MMNVWILLAALMWSMPAHACGVGEQMNGYENVNVQHAYGHWKQGASHPVPFAFVDVRTQEEYDAGHIEGAVWIPLQELATRTQELPKDKQLYVYCRSGVRSMTASDILVKAGFSKVENVQGGINAWLTAGYPVVQ